METLYNDFWNSNNSIENKFEILSNSILNNLDLIINNETYIITEIEFYLYSKFHQDKYTHRNEIQKTKLNWYFHKKGNKYKGGTYKGLDISFSGKGETYFGILIRSIKNKNSEDIIGPCNCVNEILKKFNFESIIELVDYFDSISCVDNNFLKLVQSNNYRNCDIFKSPRVGLSTKYPEFFIKEYRFATNTSKNKYSFALCLYRNDIDKQNICYKLNITLSRLNKYIKYFEQNVKNKNNKTVKSFCQNYGYFSNKKHDRISQMLKVHKEGIELFKKKNKDYGDAFAQFGPVGVLVRIQDKINRLINISKNEIIMINDEKMRDTLIDLFNYSSMAIMLLDQDN